MLLSLEEIKNYLRVDYDEDDDYIYSLIIASENYLYNATGKQFNSRNELAKQCCRVLIYDWYKDKGLTIRATKNTNVSEKVKYTVQSMIQQLKYCEDVR